MIFNNKYYYKVLELKNYASEREIKKAFRKLATEHHPDKGGDEEKMKQLSEAYIVLSKDKDNYDAWLRHISGEGIQFDFNNVPKAGPTNYNIYGGDINEILRMAKEMRIRMEKEGAFSDSSSVSSGWTWTSMFE